MIDDPPPPAPAETAHSTSWRFAPWLQLGAVLVLAFLVRANFVLDVCWHRPYDLHHTDEQFLPYEALAMWEGMTPRELGWPATPTRFMLSLGYAAQLALTAPPPSADGRMSAPILMDRVAQWSAARLADPQPLVVIGRWLSVVVGVLQVGLAFWAVRRWSSWGAGVLAALMCALAPVAVSYSQYLLADMTGVLFATWLLGMLGGHRSRVGLWPVGAGILLALATASKCHLGIWLFPALLTIWLTDEQTASAPYGQRLKYSLWLLLSFTVASLLLVPWLWLNPALMIKKFIGVVWSKLSGGPEAISAGPLANLDLTFSSMGWLTLAGLVPGCFLAWKLFGRRAIPVFTVILIGVLLIAKADEVYDRYGLLMFPAVVLVAAVGYSELLSRTHGTARAAVALGVVGLTLLTGWQLWLSQRFVGQVESYSLAHDWLMQHLKPGDRVAVDLLYTRRLPHTREQLLAELAERVSPEAYNRKMRVVGYPPVAGEPMRRAVLNDELYDVHWMRRELGIREAGEGFQVTRYYATPRFDLPLTDEVIAEFREGLKDPRRGYEVLLLNRNADLGVEPTTQFKGGTGPRLYLYYRPR